MAMYKQSAGDWSTRDTIGVGLLVFVTAVALVVALAIILGLDPAGP